jgi:cytochrome c553
MRQAIVGFSAALVLAVALVSCTSIKPGSGLLPPPLPAGAAGLSDNEIAQARDLYVAKCAKCHGFHHPAEYTETNWNYWMTKMSRKSKLQADEEQLLSRYLAAFRVETTSERQPAPDDSPR